MNLVFVYGKPATGKLTVVTELAQLCGYSLFHNHLVVDLLLSTFEFGSEPFVKLREEIWLSVFTEASRSGMSGLIFTFNPERSVGSTFVPKTVELITEQGGQVIFVELTCPMDELRRRIANPSRLAYRKLRSPAFFDELEAAGEFDTSHMPTASLTLDTSLMRPGEAAGRIHELIRSRL